MVNVCSVNYLFLSNQKLNLYDHRKYKDTFK